MVRDMISDLIITVANIISYFGICLILFFIVLIIVSKNNRTIEGYFSAVASNSIVDLMFSTIVAIIRLDSFSKNGFYVLAITRFDYEISPTLTKHIINVWMLAAHVCLDVVGIPFYIRYLLICKKQNVTHTMRILLYLFVMTCDTIIAVLLSIAFDVSPRELVELQMKPYLRGNEEGRYWNFVGAEIVSLKFIYRGLSSN